MGDHSHIEWTDATWNPITGCTRVSPGCANCYAEPVARRLERFGQPQYAGLTSMVNGRPVWTGEVRLAESALDLPLRWRKPRRVFVNSMSDLFHPNVPDAWIDRVMGVMAMSAWHTFQVLTKRPQRMREYFRGLSAANAADRFGDAMAAAGELSDEQDCHIGNAIEGVLGEGCSVGWPMRNLWLGVSCENQATADERIPPLLETPAAVRWISAEPLLGPIDLEKPFDEKGNRPPICELDWVVVGGESGPGARPCHVEWMANVVDQCTDAGVPVFVKQLGAKPFAWSGVMQAQVSWPISDRKGSEFTDFPLNLRIRQYPQPTGKEVHV